MNKKLRVASLMVLAVGSVWAARAQGPADAVSYETWNQYLGGSDSSQYTSLDQINRSNVADLEVVWTLPTSAPPTEDAGRGRGGRGGGNVIFNPIVVGDVVYLRTARGLTAVDAATGEEIWVRQIGGSNRGINYWESEDGSDRRLLLIAGGMLTALNAENGETITSFGDGGQVDLRIGMDREVPNPINTNNPGRIFENIMIVPLHTQGAGYEATPADVHAYDVRTGEQLWIFHTVPRPGEFGADTWPEEALRTAGGIHNWSEMTVDSKYGIAFVPTGTARFDFYGGNRHGDNLFANSLLALDARTGERLWHFQTIHHDLWDYDLPNAPKLLTVRHDGEEVDVVAQATKHGFLFVFERQTGEPLWPIEERPVPQTDVPGEQTSSTQPFPTAPPPFARQSFTVEDINPFLSEEDQAAVREVMLTSRNEGLFTPPSLQGTIQIPGHNGGANWGSSAVNPEEGLMFVATKELPTLIPLREPGAGGRRGGRGGRGGAEPPPPPAPEPEPEEDGFVRYTAGYDFMQYTNRLSAIGPPWSQLTAYDLNEGTIKWQIPNGDMTGLGVEGTGAQAPRGGPLATGGGLLFVGTTSDRKLRAYDQDTGEVLWEYQVGSAPDGVPASYEVDGRQYIIFPVAGGNGNFAPQMGLDPPGEGRYVVFALPE